MVQKVAQPEDIVKMAQEMYLKGSDFHKVSNIDEMREFYDRQTELSGVKKLVKSGNKLKIGDIAGGSGRQGDSVRRSLGDKADCVEIDVFDISMKAMGKGKNKVVCDSMHLKAEDKTYDILFMNNLPIPLISVEMYVGGMKAKGMEEHRDQMLEMLVLAVDSIGKLNLLEAVRVLKDDGVIVWGVPYREPSKKSSDKKERSKKTFDRESFEKVVEGLPLRVEEFQIRKYDEKLIPIWRNYGADVQKPEFIHAALRKTGSDIDETVALYEQLLYSSLEQLMRVQGKEEGKSMIEEVLEEMKKAKKFRPGKAATLDKKFNFDVGGHEPDPPWPGFFG